MQVLIDAAKLYNVLAEKDSDERGKYLLIACMDMIAGRTAQYDFVAKQPALIAIKKKKEYGAPRCKGDYSDIFKEFWKIYPRKDAKGLAYQAWCKIKDLDEMSLIEACHSALAWQITKWNDPQYIPMAATYLNQRRWEDEGTAPAKTERYMDMNGNWCERATK